MAPPACPALVGRAAESALLLRVLERAAGGSGATMALLGEAGIGRSALTRQIAEAAAELGMPVLTGRAVLGPGAPVYRPLVEALLGAVRDRPAVGDLIRRAPELAQFRDELTRLLPGVAEPGPPAQPPGEPTLGLCEGVLRLLEMLAGDTGLLLIQEDLHWADEPSLQILEYLADHLPGRRILLLSTGRVDVPVPGIERLRALQARGAVTGMNLQPLDDAAVAELAAGTIGAEVPGLATWLQEWSDGVPAMVLDLLGTATERGLLRREGKAWQFDAPGPGDPPVIPDQVAETVPRQLLELEAVQLDILRHATVLGREFDARLLPALAGVPSSDVDTLLALLWDRQLVEPCPGPRVTHRFRRALWHCALDVDLVGFQGEELADRALQTVRAAPRAARSLVRVRRHPGRALRCGRVAAVLLRESATRLLQAGAFGRAATVLDRARTLLLEPPSSAAGSVGDPDPDRDRATVDLLLLQALVEGGRLDRAREVGGALVELQQRTGVGLRVSDVEYGKTLDIAEDHRPAYRRFDVLSHLARITALDPFRWDALERVRSGTQGTGALRISVELDLTISSLRTQRMELAESLEAALRCEQNARPLGIDSTVHRAIAAQAMNHAMARRAEDLERCGARLLRLRGVHPLTTATLWFARAEFSLGRENRSQALFELDTAMRRLDGRAGGAWPLRGLWVLLRALDDADPHAARVAVRTAGWAHTPLIAAHLSYAEAVEQGRSGEKALAEEAFADAEELMGGLDGADWLHHRARRSWPRRRSPTGGVIRPPGCGSRWTASLAAGTSSRQRRAARCCGSSACRCRGSAVRWCPTRCTSSASRFASSRCSA